MRIVLLTTAIGLLLTGAGYGADCCEPASCDPAACEDPGCSKGCGSGKTCQVVCDVKIVKKTVWVVECEEFCPSLPGCGRDCGRCCESSCGGKGCGSCCDPCAALKSRPHVPPKCMPPRCRKKLVKKTIICEIPSYKCVLASCGKNGCDPAAACGCGEDGGAVEEATPEEAPPAPEATTDIAPMPPVVGASYLKALKMGN